MSEIPDMHDLARRYLDLWQEQMASVAADPKVAEALARTVALMTRSAAAMATPRPEPGARDSGGPRQGAFGDQNSQSAPNASPSGPQAAAAAPDGAIHHPDLLLRRIAELEGRVAALEAQLGAGGGAAGKRPRRRSA